MVLEKAKALGKLCIELISSLVFFTCWRLALLFLILN